MTEYVELYLDQGSDFSKTVYLTDDDDSSNINLSGYTAVSQMRRSYYSANTTANFVCSIGGANTGAITITLSSEESSNIRPGRYLFDLKVTDSNEITNRVLEGIITVTPQISK